MSKNSVNLISDVKECNKLIAMGYNESRAHELIASESAIASESGLIVLECLTPVLIEPFGDQHIERIIPEAYELMLAYDISESVMENAIKTVLKVRRPEEVSHNPERIRNFMTSFTSRCNITQLYDNEIEALLSDLTEEEIMVMSDTDCDPDIVYGDEEDGEEY